MKKISSPIEVLLTPDKVSDDTILETDYLIVGSGYGGAVAAMRLANSGPDATGRKREVVVLERGREYGPGDFPYDIEDLPAHIRMERPDARPGGYADALFNLHIGDTSEKDGSAVDVLVGSGLGGTSLINANVAERPLAHVFEKPEWPDKFRDARSPLAEEFKQVAELIGVTEHTAELVATDSGWQKARKDFPKFAALEKLGQRVKGQARPAPIAITTQNSTNGVGVKQNPCTDCGNCVTGCNVGAKNTLDRNLLRLAKSRGATFYTGATVHTVEPYNQGGYRWKVIVCPTARIGFEKEEPSLSPELPKLEEQYVILTNNVILAAGTLGSTEILLRSQKYVGNDFSPRLGERFSTNGDGVVMSYAQKNRVGALAQAAQADPVVKPGPTITGILRTKASTKSKWNIFASKYPLTIEEAAIPAALGRLFAETVTTSAMLQRLEKRKLPDFIKSRDQDPLAASMEVAEHCQALLVMGDDGAGGKLALDPVKGKIRIKFSGVKDNTSLLASHRLLRSQNMKRGLDGGQHAPNPLWQMVPPPVAEALSGEMPGGRAITVHPLGGCAMGNTVYEGVVNEDGVVFRADGKLHEGLYVLDGSIIPTALEVNPFLTIAALAWHHCSTILERLGENESAKSIVDEAYSEVGSVPGRERVNAEPTQFVIQEQLVGSLSQLTPWWKNRLSTEDAARITDVAGLVALIETRKNDAEKWLNSPGSSGVEGELKIYVNTMDVEKWEKYNPVGVSPIHLEHVAPILTLRGSFTILDEQAHGGWRDRIGAINALRSYRKRRGWDTISTPTESNILKKIFSMGKAGMVMFNIGALQSRFRTMRYDFRDEHSGITFRGDKVLGYSDDLPRMWDSLLNLDAVIAEPDGASANSRLTVNPEYLIEPGLVQVEKSAHLPQSLLFAGRLATYFARSVFSTSFWEFGGLEYPDDDLPQNTEGPEVLETLNGPVTREETKFLVTLREHVVTGEKVSETELYLTRYANPGKTPILLLHGLAQGAQIFWVEGSYGMARYFHENDFDVWLLDYRLSNRVLPNIKDHDWSMDEIAKFDIPVAVDKVLELTGKSELSVFAHCVGASSLAMAALNVPGFSAKIKSAVGNAIHPWVIGSPGNRFRSKFGGFMRDMVTEGMLDPIPKKDDGALQNMMDRIAFGLARIGEESAYDHPEYGGSDMTQGICDRMSFLYGTMWNHKNLAIATHEAFAHMLGPAPTNVYQHLYYCMQKQRVTDSGGENVYLSKTNIENNWRIPMLFVHGNDSRVFNPHSARRSARRMNETLRGAKPPVQVAIAHKIYPDYGHMDVIFGKNAHEDCYPDYLRFLNTPGGVRTPSSIDDWSDFKPDRPALGPVLRAAWSENNTIRLRLWAVLKTENVLRADVFTTKQGTHIQEESLLGAGANFPGRDVFRFIDVEAGRDQRSIDIEVRGTSGASDPEGAVLHYENQTWLQRLLGAAREPAQRRMSFMVGSCRFPGSIIDNALSDDVFATMKKHIESDNGAELLFLVGDQIYADATDQLFEVKSLDTKYTERYVRAFSAKYSPHFAELIRKVPTHFVPDDHEISDNWSGNWTAQMQVRMAPMGYVSTAKSRMMAVDTFLRSRAVEYALESCARFTGSGRQQIPIPHGTSPTPRGGAPELYYGLSHPVECDFPTFMADTRTRRGLRFNNAPTDFSLLDNDNSGDEQYSALKDWLLNAHTSNPDEPKFIVSGSIVAPLPQEYCSDSSTWRNLDGWAGYPASLESLLALILSEQIAKVVFIGGDAHMSSVSTLTLTHDDYADIKVHQIVSSGLYAPMPFANSRFEDFIWGVPHGFPVHIETDMSITCENHFLSDKHQQFVQVSATASQVVVTCFNVDDKEEETLTLAL